MRIQLLAVIKKKTIPRTLSLYSLYIHIFKRNILQKKLEAGRGNWAVWHMVIGAFIISIQTFGKSVKRLLPAVAS